MATCKRSRRILSCVSCGYQATATQNPGEHPEKTLDRLSDRSSGEQLKDVITHLSYWTMHLPPRNMTPSSLPILNSNPKLKVEKRIQNIFVTQSEDTRQRKEGSGIQIPAVTETSSRALEAGVNTLQKTLVVRKQAELNEVDAQLALKRHDFKSCMEALAHRRSELEEKQQQNKEKVMKFEKFVAENEVKRRGALKKCEATREQNILKQREIDDLTEKLNKLRARKQVLNERVAKHKIFEDYLMKTLDHLPGLYRDNGYESVVMPIIRRYETLSVTHQELLQRLGQMEVEVEQGQRQLQSMKQEHSIKKLMAHKELSDLQSELETLKEKNKQAESSLLMEQGVTRKKVEEEGRLLMAINNLAQQCYLPAYGPLESMSTLTMMDMVKEYILDKADTERRARRLMESGSALTSRAAVTDKRWRGSMKSIGSKTHIKSSSKVSKKSETFN